MVGNNYFSIGYEMYFDSDVFMLTEEVCQGALREISNKDFNQIQDVENLFVSIRHGYKYAYSYHFLPKQKQRLERGEDVTKPESKIDEMADIAINDGLSNTKVKLQWNGNNRALYDIFAQLKLMSVGNSGKTHLSDSWGTIAQFIHQSFEGMPASKTIERELEKQYQNYGIERVKKGRIEIECS